MNKCAVNGCDNFSHSHGYCSKHYSRLRRNGSTEPLYRDKSGICASNKAEYRTFRHMIERCTLPSCKDYQLYGGRGIKVCKRWLEKPYGFRNFLNDMGQKPEGYSIDRIDVNGDYCPENCRWATAKTQANNRRKRRDALEYTFNGETKTLAEWSRATGIPYKKLSQRFRSKTFDNSRLLESRDLRSYNQKYERTY